MGVLAPDPLSRDMLDAREPLLRARDVVQQFRARSRGGVVRAVSGVSFDVGAGETLAIVGESGSGKSTLARSLLQMPRPTSGSVVFRGHDLTRMRGRRLIEHRRGMQAILQDPYRSLNPKWHVAQIVEEPLIAQGIGKQPRQRRTAAVLERVGLSIDVHGRRRPAELSGGQCQRVAIARALAVKPALLICDEALSSLDVLIQAQVLNLFEQLRAELCLSYLFISHDLVVVKRISDRVAVMFLGQLCEIGSTESLYLGPLHPYTTELLASIPAWDHGRSADQAGEEAIGDPPSPIDAPSGCRFRTRCGRAQQRCAVETPVLRPVGTDHWVACHFPSSQRGREC